MIKVKDISPKSNSILPMMEMTFIYDYYTNRNLPIYFDGYLLFQGKQIGRIVNGITSQDLRLKPSEPDHYHEEVHFKCDIELSKESVSFIHEKRNLLPNQDVDLNGKIQFRNLKFYGAEIEARIISEHIQVLIHSSDWISKFAPVLGLGSFSIIEVDHTSLFSSLRDEQDEPLFPLIWSINESYRNGDWIEVIFNSRKLLEIVKNQATEIASYASNNINTDEYGRDLNALINSGFQLISKYQHTHSRKKEEINLNVTKSDAQMALYMSMSITAILNKMK